MPTGHPSSALASIFSVSLSVCLCLCLRLCLCLCLCPTHTAMMDSMVGADSMSWSISSTSLCCAASAVSAKELSPVAMAARKFSDCQKDLLCVYVCVCARARERVRVSVRERACKRGWGGREKERARARACGTLMNLFAAATRAASSLFCSECHTEHHAWVTLL